MASHDESVTKRNTLIIVIILLVATTLKLSWAATSVGTPDTARFFNIGKDLVEHGPAHVYATDPRWNQTLSVTLLMQFLLWFTDGDGDSFILWFRMPGILADIVVVVELLLMRKALGLGWGWLALAAASPINILVCGFHGNLDGPVAAGMFLAVTAAMRGRPMLSGFWLGLACHVKVAPVLLAPALAAFWWTNRGFWRFSAVFGALGALLVGSGVAIAGLPFVKHVLGYGSLWGFWGISEVMASLGLTTPEVPLEGFKNPDSGRIATISKLVIIAIAVWLAWIHRKADGRGLMRTAAATLLVFFALTPGFGHQYMVWWFAIVLAAAPIWGGILTIAATALLWVYYSAWAVSPFPWKLVVPQGPLSGPVRLVSIGAWAVFVVAAVYMVFDIIRRSKAMSSNPHTTPVDETPVRTAV